MSDSVTYALDGAVAVITLDDGKANALGHEAIAAVHDGLSRAREDASAVAIIGRPGKFSAGFDLSVMTSGTDNARELLRVGAELAIEIHEFPMPVVLGVTGHALAMGAILLLAADTRIGGDGPAKIGLNEVAIGMPVPRFAVELARHRLVPAAFIPAINHARIYDPEGAHGVGYLDQVVPADDVPAAAVAHAAHLGETLRRGAFVATRANCRGQITEQLRHDLAADLTEFVVELPAS
ncbi:crotonase/enoyl-CoA hydratase family protein [Rhabdothermincola salaria]|uniref:crotonase/enoyl-CoA hydratase family protein n=1 Tax=Rhabdothermincola salaria TaxID=2903142 RepID=UPI001E35C538|nr:crotonase/enoyl-CoA hydratase family protein [Rhabdothermincola salaria]MCD9623836.1 crotonase/enoyl-CoA hydratase family protein [Rhabdothermincola salaria]